MKVLAASEMHKAADQVECECDKSVADGNVSETERAKKLLQMTQAAHRRNLHSESDKNHHMATHSISGGRVHKTPVSSSIDTHRIPPVAPCCGFMA